MSEPHHMPMFREIRPMLSRQAVREILLAAHSRKVSRLCLFEALVPRLVNILERSGLYVDLHDRKQILAPDSGKGGWVSGYGVEVPVESPLDGYLHLYVGADPALVLAAKKAEHENRYADFGLLLGYPPCCIEFYQDNLAGAEARQGDFLLPLLGRSLAQVTAHPPLFPAWTNIAAQYFDYGLISFYPCSFFCRRAAALAQDALRLIGMYDADMADEYVLMSRMPVLYTEYDGVYLFREASLEGDCLHYDPARIEHSLDGVVLSLLSRANRIRIGRAGSLELRDGRRLICRLQGGGCGLLLWDAPP
jgi:hypothetical protein